MQAWILLVIMGMIAGCEETGGPDYEGEIVLSSRFSFADASVMGYNFEESGFTPFPSGGEPLPDVIVEKYTQVDGSIEPGFNSPSNDHGFYQLGAFGSAAAAGSFFNQYREIETDLDFSPMTDTVRTNDVYLLMTRNGAFAKLWVKEITYLDDNTGTYTEITTAFEYQDDGSGQFAPRTAGAGRDLSRSGKLIAGCPAVPGEMRGKRDLKRFCREFERYKALSVN